MNWMRRLRRRVGMIERGGKGGRDLLRSLTVRWADLRCVWSWRWKALRLDDHRRLIHRV
jgi:hypothetical protein